MTKCYAQESKTFIVRDKSVKVRKGDSVNVSKNEIKTR